MKSQFNTTFYGLLPRSVNCSKYQPKIASKGRVLWPGGLGMARINTGKDWEQNPYVASGC